MVKQHKYSISIFLRFADFDLLSPNWRTSFFFYSVLLIDGIHFCLLFSVFLINSAPNFSQHENGLKVKHGTIYMQKEILILPLPQLKKIKYF